MRLKKEKKKMQDSLTIIVYVSFSFIQFCLNWHFAVEKGGKRRVGVCEQDVT